MDDKQTGFFLNQKLQHYFSIPVWCFSCKKYIASELESPSPYLCSICYQKLPFTEKALCPKCGLKHSPISCQSTWAKDITQFKAVFNYQEPISGWISNLKYFRNLFAGKILQQLISNWFNQHQQLIEPIDLLLPVPLHSTRLHWRSFNQAVYLLKKQKQLPVNSNILKRIRKTPHQAGLSKENRNQNMENAFRVKKSLNKTSVLLFDDVCTTGTTIGELCQVLKAAGVENIHVLTLARVI